MKRILTGLLVFGVAIASQAGWTMLDNFDSYDNSVETKTTDASGGIWSAEFVGTGNSHIEDTDQGQSLVTYGGAAWRGADRDLSGTDAAVTVGEIQSFFWQAKVASNWSGAGWDFMMGLSPSVSNIDTGDAWRDFNVMPYIAGSGTPSLSASGATGSSQELNREEWYNIWLVVNNDALDPTFDVYLSQGANDGVLVLQDADWRNTGEPGMGINQDLNAIGFMAAGWDQTAYTIDNIYYADGVDTTYAIPEPATFGLVGVFGAAVLFVRRRFTI